MLIDRKRSVVHWGKTNSQVFGKVGAFKPMYLHFVLLAGITSFGCAQGGNMEMTFEFFMETQINPLSKSLVVEGVTSLTVGASSTPPNYALKNTPQCSHLTCLHGICNKETPNY